MRRNIPGLFVLGIVAMLALSTASLTPARAASGASFTGYTPNSGSGCVFGIGNYNIQFTGTVDDVGGQDYVSVIIKDATGLYGDVDFWSTSSASGVGTFGDATGFNSAPAARPFTLELWDIGNPTGVVADTPAGQALTLAGTRLASFTFDPYPGVPACASLPLVAAAPAAPVFSGPALPANANLVLITGDIGVQQEPDGKPTGLALKKCQTAFVYETSKDGKWYKVFIMGGWIPVNATRDVAETYGQSGGEPIDPACVGK